MIARIHGICSKAKLFAFRRALEYSLRCRLRLLRKVALARALIGVKRVIGALQQLFGGFPWLVVRPAARESDRNPSTLIFDLKSVDARHDMPNLFRTALRQKRHELVATQPHR